jgi:hypothetical protein
MADGFIVRRGGRAEDGEPTPSPTITFVSKTDSSITFTLTNNSVVTRDVTYGLTTPPEDETITLASLETSANQTISGLDDDTEFTIFAQAEDSAIVSLTVTTEPAPIYTAATGGTTEDYNLDNKRYRSHTFTSDGNFVVTTVGNGDRNQVDYLIIAGGGGGGGGFQGGGGGAGGFLSSITPTPSDSQPSPKFTVSATTYGVNVGAGGNGAPGTDTSAAADNGDNSSVFNFVAVGGGRGATERSGIVNDTTASVGGSGGGGTHPSDLFLGANGTTGQGRKGGDGASTDPRTTGGGGGAGEEGTDGTSSTGGKGGDGLANLLRTGSNETRAGGGGGTLRNSTGGSGGAGGGGAGGSSPGAGTVNTGGGGGGGTGSSGSSSGANGGSGIVIIRYEIAPSV